MTSDASNQLFDRFAGALAPDERVQVLTELMKEKLIPKHASDPRFNAGLEQWVSLANAGATAPRERLLAIAELVRATQQLKSRQPALLARVDPTFEQPLPPLSLLDDSEARLNVARACSQIDRPWLQAYRASSIACDGAKVSNARKEMAESLVAHAPSIAAALELLQMHFEAVEPGTESPGDALARRLTSALKDFRGALQKATLDAGAEVGKKLEGLIRSPLANTGRPTEEAVRIDLTREVALTLHDLVRSRFSLATEPQTFDVLQYCRSFFTSVSWPSAVHEETGLLVEDVSEALVLLARMRVPSQDLLRRLELVCGLPERAKAVAAALADKHVEVDEDIRSWLRTGRQVNTIAPSEVLQESLLASMDEALGLALIEAREFQLRSDSERRLADSLEIFDAGLLKSFTAFASQSRAMRDAIEDLAKRREIDLFGIVGDEVDFAPKYFDTITPLTGMRVIVRRPAVVRSGVGGGGMVVKKGLVE
jgi:hypothetical protein